MTNVTRSFAHSISVFAARAVCAKRPSVATRAMCAAQACALAALLATPAVAVASAWFVCKCKNTSWDSHQRWEAHPARN